MSGRPPALRGAAVFHALEKAGFVVVRIKGSHHIMEHGDDPARRTVVPVHAGRDRMEIAVCSPASVTAAP
jgi:predicted RNA binding protein YcfA (HicA-like mRNA interferase family)